MPAVGAGAGGRELVLAEEADAGTDADGLRWYSVERIDMQQPGVAVLPAQELVEGRPKQRGEGIALWVTLSQLAGAMVRRRTTLTEYDNTVAIAEPGTSTKQHQDAETVIPVTSIMKLPKPSKEWGLTELRRISEEDEMINQMDTAGVLEEHQRAR
jgi:hypothetical protein